jgi:hypothetical protein
MKKSNIMWSITFLVSLSYSQLLGLDYCNHPSIKAQVEALKKRIPLQTDEVTTLFNFQCMDSRYLYYSIVDTSNMNNMELEQMYRFHKNRADSFNDQTKGVLHARYIFHTADGTILKIVDGK